MTLRWQRRKIEIRTPAGWIDVGSARSDVSVPVEVDDATWRKVCDVAQRALELELQETAHCGPLKALRNELDQAKTKFDKSLFDRAVETVLIPKRDQPGMMITTVSGLDSPLLHSRLQLPVGQGGFHFAGLHMLIFDNEGVAVADVANSPFAWVYDCGSIPRKYVDREIDWLVTDRASGHLDFLFLSHFDQDHMLGVPRLLHQKGGLTADTIVIPHLDDTERLIELGRASALRPHGKMEPFFASMVLNPLKALEELRVRRIILVGRGDDDEGDLGGLDPFEPLPTSDPDGGEDAFAWKITPNPGDPTDVPRCWHVNRKTVLMRGGAFEVSKGREAPLWHFVPYVERTDPNCVRDFKLACEVLFKWTRGSFAKRMAEPEVRRDAVSSGRSKLGQAYEYAFGDKNLTSMSLYSGPARLSDAMSVRISPWHGQDDPARISWMGTGDAHLKAADEINAFESHYSSLLHSVSTFMLPHHGSIMNSDPHRLVSDADEWVVAADPTDPAWKHPHDDLVAEISAREKQLRHVRAASSTRFFEFGIVGWK